MSYPKITSQSIRFIASLSQKKYRNKKQCFLVEGEKAVEELLASHYEVVIIVATSSYLESHTTLLCHLVNTNILTATSYQLTRCGFFQTNNNVLAVARQQPREILTPHKEEFVLALDNIRNPGNLGTIIRTADWFGISKIVASIHTVDFYNQKVINATMGSFSRVHISYMPLEEYFSVVRLPVYGMSLDGHDISTTVFESSGILLLGNESNGISSHLLPYVRQKITIPKKGKADSLNVAIATGIALDYLTRTKN